jgi:predicted type IV restriction endonuclease
MKVKESIKSKDTLHVVSEQEQNNMLIIVRVRKFAPQHQGIPEQQVN